MTELSDLTSLNKKLVFLYSNNIYGIGDSGFICPPVAGVCEEFRKQGIAGLLLENLIAHLTSETYQLVKALYLHVLTTNSQAITFYEHR